MGRREPQFLKLTLALVDRGAYDESLRIYADLLELIENFTAGFPLSHRIAELLKVAFCATSNLSIIMVGIVGFYGLMIMVDLLLLLLTKISVYRLTFNYW